MEYVMMVVVAMVALLLGGLIGANLANRKHLSQRGTIAAKTITVCREIIYSEMASLEFHAAVMTMVHPDANAQDGFQHPQLPEGGQTIVNLTAEQWLTNNATPAKRRKR